MVASRFSRSPHQVPWPAIPQDLPYRPCIAYGEFRAHIAPPAPLALRLGFGSQNKVLPRCPFICPPILVSIPSLSWVFGMEYYLLLKPTVREIQTYILHISAHLSTLANCRFTVTVGSIGILHLCIGVVWLSIYSFRGASKVLLKALSSRQEFEDFLIMDVLWLLAHSVLAVGLCLIRAMILLPILWYDTIDPYFQKMLRDTFSSRQSMSHSWRTLLLSLRYYREWKARQIGASMRQSFPCERLGDRASRFGTPYLYLRNSSLWLLPSSCTATSILYPSSAKLRFEFVTGGASDDEFLQFLFESGQVSFTTRWRPVEAGRVTSKHHDRGSRTPEHPHGGTRAERLVWPCEFVGDARHRPLSHLQQHISGQYDPKVMSSICTSAR
ncbi:hypothetical protein FB45DRAFT_452755 [Roridomyces roridus]|uniref:Uncharacterized protein n=1 Tax=Roridomyces roridus TaxID=1738132 RepID=A0AAD7C278_9AGAR|nr:hypothetical protein FB45DRAFT_452755 [Roridomyces roridus]